MMKAILLAGLLVPGAALAAQPAASSGKKTDGMICREIGVTGSRLDTQRVCMTRQQWEDSRRDARQTIEQAQTHQGNPKGG
jgi:hypothetical protein